MKKCEGKFPFYMYSRSGEGRIVEAHTNTSLTEIVEILSGEVNVQIGTELIVGKTGDFLYVPPTLVFCMEAATPKAAIRALVFDSSIIEDNMENFDAEVFYMFYLQSKNKIAPFKPGHPVYETLSLRMADSYDEHAGKDVCYNLPIRANIYLMMNALLRYYCGTKDDADRMVYHNVLRMRPVIEYISEHYCEKIYIEKLSDMLNISSDYFTKTFKDSIGKTPIEYINGLRVNESMRRLSEGDESIAAIAEAIGFCNANYFHKIFKQYMGVSPIVYRKSTRK